MFIQNCWYPVSSRGVSCVLSSYSNKEKKIGFVIILIFNARENLYDVNSGGDSGNLVATPLVAADYSWISWTHGSWWDSAV